MNKKEQAIQWAQNLLKSPFCIVDTEATGLDPGADEIVQIAVIDQDGATLLLSDLKPMTPIDESGKAFAIHGIGNERLANAPSWSDIHARLCEVVADKPLVIYNRLFDEAMITAAYDRAGLLCPQPSLWCCALLEYADFRGEPGKYNKPKWHSFENATKQMGLPVLDAHDALQDCLMTLALIRAMAGTHTDCFEGEPFELVLCE